MRRSLNLLKRSLNPLLSFLSVLFLLAACTARGQVSVPTAPPVRAASKDFRDGRFGVRFRIPAGWTLTRKDGEVSTFHLDARTAPARTVVRGVAAIEFNPFPETTLSGAMFYFSVAPHTSDAECARQAVKPGEQREFQDIGGMSFAHAHDQHGGICVEARDEVYTRIARERATGSIWRSTRSVRSRAGRRRFPSGNWTIFKAG